ncbi:hypothetical protein EZ428_21640 [Pedobacter frigiditerrae]|uniref:DUF4468 domain-containing protein n=1 Tax=Pedobacter frigiditerrae TaxID=2530452 RepID=A0A4R0MKW1_9SPHI|nr:hypothetical protein [Pedobacter frigiditerrae]TCC87305.1 hypothetical protein EZ428_21640 [Pedobacter frigiditerrae]
MKKNLLMLFCVLLSHHFCVAQINVFPDTGKVGIGTATPRGRLEVNDWIPSLVISGRKHSEAMVDNEVIGKIDFYKHYGLAYAAAIKLVHAGGTSQYAQAHLTFYTSSDQNPYTSIPLERMRITSTGEVAIGSIDPKGYKLAVNGNIRAKEIRVEPNPATWPDYVFEADYRVGTLEELERYVKINKHLPEMPTAKEVGTNGVELGEMNRLLLKKVEELTLLLIQKDKELSVEKETNKNQTQMINALDVRVNNIYKKLNN